MNHKKPSFTYQQTDSIRLECIIDLGRLFETVKERDNFDVKWPAFLHSDPCNKKIFKLHRNRLIYYSEHLVPKKKDNRPPLLFVFGNPASHSVDCGMYFAFAKNGKENRFWKAILKPAGILNFSFDENLPADQLNHLRKKQFIHLDYESPFRIGLCVFISMPGAPGGQWGGVAGIRKLIGAKALKKLESEERRRIIKCASAFIGNDSRGKIVIFQKNAWEGLRSEKDSEYAIDMVKKGKLKGHLKDSPAISIFGVPPTRLIGPCRDMLRKYLSYKNA